MSTKTTFKRVALVAVAALGFGMLSVVPSNAAPITPGHIDVSLDSTGPITIDQKTGTGIAGASNYVQITQTALGAVTGYHIVATGGTLVANAATSASVSGSGTSSVIVANNVTAVLNVPTPTAGTILIKNYAITNGVESGTATSTITITVLAAATGTVYSSTTVTATTVAAAPTVYTYTNAATGVVTRLADASATTATALYSFDVDQLDAAGTSLTPATTKAVTATMSGVGSLSLLNTGAVSQYVAASAGTSLITVPNGQDVYVYSDGRSGKGTLTIAVNGVTVKSYDIIFWGAKASYTAVSDADYLPALGSANSLTVTAKDANGQVVPNSTWVAASSSSTTATITASGTTSDCAIAACTAPEWLVFGTSSAVITGLAKGSATFTVANSATTPTITAAATVKVTGAQIASLTWAFDKAEYAPGEKAVVTLTAKDSDGNPVGDDTYTIWKTTGIASASRSVSNYISTLTLVAPTVAEYFVSGSASYSFYVPATTGEFKVSGTTSVDADLAVALQGAAVSISSTVANADIQAAADAAAEATDAANAATDAANAAAEAADAATAAAQDASDAVAALSAQVATLISGLKAQLTALTNLVIKIQKKVKA